MAAMENILEEVFVRSFLLEENNSYEGLLVVIKKNRRSNFFFSVSYENERRKTEMIIRVLLSKDVGKQKMKTDGSNSNFNVVGKRKTKTESRIPFSDDVGKNETECSNSIFLFRSETVGTKVHTRRICKPLAACGS